MSRRDASFSFLSPILKKGSGWEFRVAQGVNTPVPLFYEKRKDAKISRDALSKSTASKTVSNMPLFNAIVDAMKETASIASNGVADNSEEEE